MCYLNGLTGTSFDWQYTTTAQAGASNNQLKWPRGKGLGGSSAINGGFWCIGGSAEYDAWNSLQDSGGENWGWDEFHTYFKKVALCGQSFRLQLTRTQTQVETFTAMDDADASTFSVTHDSSSHGTDGPVHSSYSNYQFSLLKNWIPTLQNMGLSHLTDPANGTVNGVGWVPSIINPTNGSRSDSKTAYIDPNARSNLVILTGQQATRVIWNSTADGSAVAGGVAFSASASYAESTVYATKEVILS